MASAGVAGALIGLHPGLGAGGRPVVRHRAWGHRAGPQPRKWAGPRGQAGL